METRTMEMKRREMLMGSFANIYKQIMRVETSLCYSDCS